MFGSLRCPLPAAGWGEVEACSHPPHLPAPGVKTWTVMRQVLLRRPGAAGTGGGFRWPRSIDSLQVKKGQQVIKENMHMKFLLRCIFKMINVLILF